ncbi:MAG: hypothetical protein E7353_06785 [Clostridiales bacterium]|nr:hypothetical protein [Clostridiales bacterium]
MSYKKSKGKWSRSHLFLKRKKTKNEEGHPAYIFERNKNQRRYLAFTHSSSTNKIKNIELDKNVDSRDNRKCHVHPIAKIANVNDFEKPVNPYSLKTNRDKELIKGIISKNKRK